MSLKGVKRQAKKMVRNGSLYGLEFDDLEITGRSIKAVGDYDGFGEMDLVVNFSRRSKVQSIILSVDFYDYDGRLIQSYSFTNYKKYQNATTSRRWENVHSNAVRAFNLNTVDSIQRGVDLYERLPGVKDVQVQSIMFDGSPSNFWT